jgi:hypothetical protein
MRRGVTWWALLALLFANGACGGSTPPAREHASASTAPRPHHADLVDSVVIRSVTGRAEGASDEVLSYARDETVRDVANELDALPEDEVRQIRLDVSLAEVTVQPATIRVRALISLSTVGPPERMHAVLQGGGTVQRGSTERADLELATRGAIRGALRRFAQVLATARGE